MRLAIMQPYFMPYIGYFQLVSAVDEFVVYDNIKYTKKGWINRNRMLLNGADTIFSLPLKKGSDALEVRERELAEDFSAEKILRKFAAAYSRAPYFAEVWPLIERIVRFEATNLFEYLHHSILCICAHLQLKAKISVSSDIAINHDLKGQEKVITICQALGAKTYVNAVGGMALYNEKDDFLACGIDIKFVRSKPFEYSQFGGAFVPWLSIMDVLMFNDRARVVDAIHNGFDLI